jgi:GNAT superfamily N-acetyltransferase
MKSYKQTIAEVGDDNALHNNVIVIQNSFRTVAEEFSLTIENCPTHPFFVTIQQLKVLKAKGVRLFGLFLSADQVGFVAVERANETLYYMEKLAVLPEYRHKGYSTKLVAFVLDYVRNGGGQRLSIGIIDEHKVLKDWYGKLGFVEISTTKFPHLPFTVCFMGRDSSPL